MPYLLVAIILAWVAMEVVPASAGSTALSAQPPTHAAVLFIDFIFSPEGQKILERFDYGSAVKDYGFKRWYIERGMTPDQLEKKVPVGRRRFASSRENEVTSSQMAVARVIVEDQLNKLAIDFLTGQLAAV